MHTEYGKKTDELLLVPSMSRQYTPHMHKRWLGAFAVGCTIHMWTFMSGELWTFCLHAWHLMKKNPFSHMPFSTSRIRPYISKYSAEP